MKPTKETQIGELVRKFVCQSSTDKNRELLGIAILTITAALEVNNEYSENKKSIGCTSEELKKWKWTETVFEIYAKESGQHNEYKRRIN